jgi:hypothetical protein
MYSGLLPADTIRPLPLQRYLEQLGPGVGIMDQRVLVLAHGSVSGWGWGWRPQPAQAGTVRLESNGFSHHRGVW